MTTRVKRADRKAAILRLLGEWPREPLQGKQIATRLGARFCGKFRGLLGEMVAGGLLTNARGDGYAPAKGRTT